MTITKTSAMQKFVFSGLLLMMVTFALVVAIVGVPAISASTGLAREYVTYGLAGVAFVVAIVATRWAKSLTKKQSVE